MSIKEKSDDAVIKSGQKRERYLKEGGYLHNFYGNYQEISGSFERVDIYMMEAIQQRILKRQKQEEDKIYKILGVRGVDELNELYMKSGGDNKFLNSSIKDIIGEASKNALTDLSGYTTNMKISAFNTAVENTLNEMIEEEFAQKDKEMIEALKKGLGEKIANRLAKSQKDKHRSTNMNKYIENISKAIAANYRGEILETQTGIVMARIMDELVGKNRNSVKLTATVRNSNGKQIKADNTFVVDNKIEVGISDKNYKTDSSGNVEVSLHTSGSLENFYNLVSRGKLLGRAKIDMSQIQNLISKFREPEFKYHLINQAAFAGVKNIEGTDVGANIIEFIKQCLPLFIGAQFKIEGDSINVDFFNINGTLIPVSTIMEDCFNGGSLTGLRIGLYNNYQVPWYEMLKKKTKIPVEDDQYYMEEERDIGNFYGNNLYKEINVGTIHLKVALANLK